MGCAISTIKYILFLFNFFLVLSGILLVVIGILSNSNASNFKDLLAGNVSFASWLLIGTGVVVFVIAFFGCCGAIQESHCMMTTYAIFLLTLFFVEVGIGILAFVYRSNAQEYLSTAVDHLFDKYDSNEDAKRAVDAVQRELRCCGTSGPSSWGGSYPPSCCNELNRSELKWVTSCPPDEMWTVGCIERLTVYSRDVLTRMGFIAITVAAIELVGIVFSLCLASSIRRSELRGYA